ncbi:DNA-binding protein [Brachybacterium sp. P6-10-X1]|uniref:FAD/NAD(P)-binding protein n=1 Tax=Brachybacterium sp. P6-10-X1 TaxID=1903186 RepID=UPI000971AFF0|nr:FAD/NAD(P)-binding protein [Brachybacterium sp. P6-10-X1]APX33726.1 DNA-binding protein [Brachybacterium sp. P6-10-X1]
MNVPVRTAGTRVVVVGGGPRAIGVLERLAASAALPEQAARLEDSPLHVDIVDPHMPGAGRIWRAVESPLLLMNSRAADVSIFTDDTVEIDGPVVAGPSLAEWAAGIRQGTLAAPTSGSTRLAEIEAIEPTSFAGRRVQALYLEWFLGQVLAALPATVTVTVHRTTATAVHRTTATAGDDESSARWSVELEDRAPLSADLLVLAAGHTDARPSPARYELAAFARRHGGTYLPPSQAGDAHLDQLAAGQETIVRGMGLGFIDLMALLTEGRGGSFEPDPLPGEPGRLRYLPSGREPHLHVGSRRGVPYHSKVRDEGERTSLGELVHVTASALREREDAGGRLDLRADVVPLIAAEIAHWVPDAPVAAPDQEPLAWLDDPLSWLEGDAEPRATREAVVRHIESDLRERTQGDVTSARTLFQLLLRLHGVLVDQLPTTRLRESSRGDHPRWWHSLFSFVDSGPPPHRLHQLLALERAGVVSFLGPRTVVTADDVTGRFVARRGAGVRVEATALVDAFLPESSLTESTNPLLRSLVSGGAAAVGREATAAPGKLEIDAGSHVIGPDGTVHETLWAVGPWTSELPIGAFARPRTNAPCHRRNDALARNLLEAALAHGETRGTRRPRRGALAGGTPPAAPPAPRGAALAPRLGVLGPGRIGSALARTALRAGMEVRVVGRAPAPALAARLPGAAPVALEDLSAYCDIVLLTVPLHVALRLDPQALRGVIVVDATNPWGEEDAAAVAEARIALGDQDGALSTSELVAAHLSVSRVVKTLNHIGYHDVEDQGRDGGEPGRRAIAVASDDRLAAEAVGALLHRLGYDGEMIGSLADGRHVEPGAGLFAGWSTRAELHARRRELVRVA